ARIFRARGHAPSATRGREEAQEGKCRLRVDVRADHRRDRLGADPEPDHADFRHGLHGAHLQAARRERQTSWVNYSNDAGAGVFGLNTQTYRTLPSLIV